MKNMSIKIIRFVAGIILICGLFFLGYKLSDLLIYVLISLVLTLILKPLTEKIADFRIKNFLLPRSVAALISLLLFFALVSAAFSIFIPSIAKEIEGLSNIKQEQVYENLGGLLEKGDYLLSNYEKIAGLKKGDGIEQIKKYFSEKALEITSFKEIGFFINSIFSALGSFLIGLFSVLFITFYFLKESNLTWTIISTITPDRILPQIKHILQKTRDILSRYFIGLLVEMLFMSTIVTLGLFFLGVKNAELIGLFVGIINIIPYIGPTIGAVFGVTLTVISGISDYEVNSFIPLILKVVGTIAFAQIVDNTILQPQIFSKSVFAHPLEVFIIIIAAGTLYGIVGMVLAVPAYTVLRIILKEFLSNYKVISALTKGI